MRSKLCTNWIIRNKRDIVLTTRSPTQALISHLKDKNWISQMKNKDEMLDDTLGPEEITVEVNWRKI